MNNVVYFHGILVDVATFRVLSNLKILMTGLMSVMILGRRLTGKKWLALCLLSVGAVLVQSSAGAVANGSNLMGFCFVVLHSSLSAFSGIFTEKLLKTKKRSIYASNCYLYFYMACLNLAWLIVPPGPRARAAAHGGSLFYGFGPLVVFCSVNAAALGLFVSFIMKYFDNIVKVIAMLSRCC